MVAIFTYGSLMCADIMSAVARQPVSGQSACLADHRRFAIEGEVYPGVIAVPGQQVNGILYTDVHADAVARLDTFEGDWYCRESVNVSLEDGSSLAAQVYLIRAEHTHRLAGSDWDFDAFLAAGKQAFVDDYIGYRRC